MTRTHTVHPQWIPAAILLGVAAITLLCWWTTPPSSPISDAAAIGQLIGAWAMAGFAILFLATTRHPRVSQQNRAPWLSLVNGFLGLGIPSKLGMLSPCVTVPVSQVGVGVVR